MPLLMVCLEGLGKLAQKFPNIASTSIYHLQDFLIAPSPILLKLHRQYSECSAKELQFKVLGKLYYYSIILHFYQKIILHIKYIFFGQFKGKK